MTHEQLQAKLQAYEDSDEGGQIMRDEFPALCDLLFAVREFLAEAHQGWQPIEAAPRDGTEIVLWSDEWDLVCSGYWARGSERWESFGEVFAAKSPKLWCLLPLTSQKAATR